MDTVNGIFWRPDSPEQRIPGLLSTTEDGATTLELATSITPAMEALSNGAVTASSIMVPAGDPLDFVVHGALSTPPVAVSLIDCWTKNRQTRHTAMGAIESQTVRAGRVVRGAFISGSAALYNGVRLRVEGIDSWAGLPDPWPDRSGNGELALRFRPLENETVALPSGAEIVLTESIGWRQRVSIDTTVHRGARLQVTGFVGLTYQQVDAQFLTPLVGFLSFVLGRTASPTLIELRHEDKWVAMRHVGIYKEDEIQASKVRPLLPLHDAGMGIAASFLSVYGTVGPAVPIRQDMLSNRRSSTVETQVLELTTVAEGLHRDLYRLLEVNRAGGVVRR